MRAAFGYKKYIIIVLTAALLPILVSAAGFELSWRDYEGGGTSCSPPLLHNSKSSAVTLDANGYVYLACFGQGALRVVKWLPSGQSPVWDRTVAPDGVNGIPIDIVVDVFGNAYVSYYPATGGELTRKFNNAGNEVINSNWPKTIGRGSLALDSSGYIYVSTMTPFGAAVNKYDAAGTPIQSNFVTNFLNTLRDIAVDGSGRVYALAMEGGGVASIVRMLPSGSLDASWGAGGKAQYTAASLIPNAIAVAGDGSVYVTGTTSCCGTWNGMTVKFSSSGASMQHHQVNSIDGAVYALRTRDVAVDTNNNVYVVGYAAAPQGHDDSTVLLKYNSNLQLQEDLFFFAADLFPGALNSDKLISEAIAFNRFQANNENQFYIGGFAGRATHAFYGPFAAGYRTDTPPVAPTNIRVTAGVGAECRSLRLLWNANSELDIRSYRIYRNSGSGMALVATLPASQISYLDPNLDPAVTYSYQVEAIDMTGNVSPRSVAASAKPNECPDTTPPGVPTGVSATRASCTQIDVGWNASVDNAGGSGIQGYHVYRNGTKITSSPVAGTSYSDPGLASNTTYSYQITAVDKTNNESARSISASATTQCSPSADIKANGSDGPVMIEHNTSAVLSWCGSPAAVCANASSCSVAPGGWSGTSRTQSTGNLTASQTYTLSCTGPGGSVQDSVTINVSAGGDTAPPSTPTITSVSNSVCSQLRISWTASTDNVAVAGYNMYRNGSAVPLNSSLIVGTSYTDVAITPGVSYSYRVRAVDTSNNVSSLSNAVSGTPTQCPDTSPPVPPPDVTLSLGAGAEARCNSINVFWTQSNDPESGIARYDLWRRVGGVGAFGLHRTFLPGSGEFNSRTFIDTSLNASMLHEYIVRAVNGAGLWTDSSLEGLETAACPGPVGTDKFDLSANPILLTATVIGGSSALATSSATFITVTPQAGLPAGAQVTLMLDKPASHAVAQTLTPRFIKSGAITSEITLTFANPTAPQSVVFRLAVPHNTALGIYEPMVIRAKDTDKTTNVKLRTEFGGTGER